MAWVTRQSRRLSGSSPSCARSVTRCTNGASSGPGRCTAPGQAAGTRTIASPRRCHQGRCDRFRCCALIRGRPLKRSAEHEPVRRAGVAAAIHPSSEVVLQLRGVAGVVPDVRAPVPVAVGPGTGTVPGVDLDEAVAIEAIAVEHEHVPGGVAQRPVLEADLRAGGVVQLDSQHAGLMRQAFAHEAILLLEPAADERALRCGCRGGVVRAWGPRAAVSFVATPRARRPGGQRPARQGCVRGRARNRASGTAAHRTGPVRTMAVPGRLRHPVATPGKLAQRGATGRDRSSRTPDAQLTGPACTWDGRNLEPGWMVRALDPRPGWPAHRAAGDGPCPAPGPQATAV